MTLHQEFLYVKRMINSCITPKQKETAHDWAWNWSKLMKNKYPDLVISQTDLFLDVIGSE
jgi:hypothetical protein